MEILDAFRNSQTAAALREQIAALAASLEQSAPGKIVRIMEVCGTHTMAIARHGIRTILPRNIDLISGPGCPVCVTDAGYIDAAVNLARQGAIIVTFGDMLKVPGTSASLLQCRAEGARVEVCYSPLEALEHAAGERTRQVVFLAVGFETTTAPVVSLIPKARALELKNISLLTAFKVVPPALEILAADPAIRINAFLCPAHVSAIIGARAYAPVVEKFKTPAVIAGFEPLDILLGIKGILQQLAAGEAGVDNQYSRVVKPQGNLKAQAVIQEHLMPATVAWRGLGALPGSGLALRPEYAEYDAEKRLGVKIESTKLKSGCRCGDVLKGILKPNQCALFAGTCTPEHPLGPCMVSSEGSCAAYFKYSRLTSAVEN